MKLFLGVMPLQVQHADSAALLPPPQLPQTGLRYHKVATREIDAAVSPLAPRSAWGAGLRGVDVDCEWGRSPYPAQGGESRHVCCFEGQDADVNRDYVSQSRHSLCGCQGQGAVSGCMLHQHVQRRHPRPVNVRSVGRALFTEHQPICRLRSQATRTSCTHRTGDRTRWEADGDETSGISR